MTDFRYDQLWNELKFLEDSTGIILTNSPTQKVSGDILSELTPVQHGDVSIHIGEGNERKTISCNVWDDTYINAIIAHLNFGTELKGDKTYANS